MSNTVRCPDCGGAGQELSATGSSNDCPNCDGKGLISNIPDDVMARVLLAEESDHTPAALPSADSSGSDKEPLPSGSGEQPTSVGLEQKLALHYNTVWGETDRRAVGMYVMQLMEYIAEERRQAKIAELELLQQTKWADLAYDIPGYLKDRLKTLRGENNE